MAKQILTGIGTIAGTALGPLGSILGGAAGSALGGLFGKKKTAAATPAPATTAKIMPIADDAAVMRARKKGITQQMMRGGRSSTILTGNTETLGS